MQPFCLARQSAFSSLKGKGPFNMQKKPKLRELISRAKAGDRQALAEIVQRLTPLVKKYSRRLGYTDACSDLVSWILAAVKRYKPKTAWGKNELERYFSRQPKRRGK
jgi:hypothetical protein